MDTSSPIDIDGGSKAPVVSERAIQHEKDGEAILKAAYRKSDIRLLAFYTLVLFFMRIESHNITNAAIMNIEAKTDIKHQLGDLSSRHWALILSMYYYPYIILEPLSALGLKKFTPRKWMSRIMLTWAIVAMCHGATQNFAGLLACRFLLGVCEAGFTPCVIYHVSFWYPADRLPLRVAFFAAIGQLSGTFSGLLAFAISFLNGRAGLEGWRYLFILEGIPVVLCGIYSLFCLPNYPQDATFLTEPEREHILEDHPNNQPNSTDKSWDWQQVKAVLRDPTTLTFCLVWACHAIGARGVMTVLPTVIYELGFTHTTVAQLLTMPPHLVGCILLAVIAWLISLKRLKPWLAAMCLEGFSCACYVVLFTVHNPVVKYIFVVLATTASVGVIPVLWPERIRASNGTTGAAIAIGLTCAASTLHGIVGPQIYQDKFRPTYRVSFGVSIGLIVVGIGGMLMTFLILRQREEKRG